MKKLFIFINSLILLISCNNCNQLPSETSNISPQTQRFDRVYIKLPKISTQSIGTVGIEIFNITYKEHEYLFFRTGGNSRAATSACVHNPDCKYCKNK